MEEAVFSSVDRLQTPPAVESLISTPLFDALDLENVFAPRAQCAQLNLHPFAGGATILNLGSVRIVAHATQGSFQLTRRPALGRISLAYANRPAIVMQRGRPITLRDIVVTGGGAVELNVIGPAELVWIDIDLAEVPPRLAKAFAAAIPREENLLTGRDVTFAALRRYISSLVLFHLNGLPAQQLQSRVNEVIELVQCALEAARVKPRSRAREKAYSLVERVEKFMWENVEDPLSLKRICEAAGCRSRSLTYYFKALVGVGPMTYLKIRRLENAHRRLKESNGPVRIFDVAADFGFWHMGHFSADYKRMFGITASETRKAYLSR